MEDNSHVSFVKKATLKCSEAVVYTHKPSFLWLAFIACTGWLLGGKKITGDKPGLAATPACTYYNNAQYEFCRKNFCDVAV